MTDLVVQRHADVAQADAGEPRAIQRLPARRDVVGAAHNCRQRLRERANGFLRHQADDRVRILRVQRLYRMRHGVHAGSGGDVRRQRQGELRIVEHRARQHAGVAPGFLEPPFGQAVDGRDFRPSIRGGHGDDRLRRFQCDGLPQTDRGTSADGHVTVGAEPRRLFARCSGDLGWHVHHRLGIDANGALTEQAGHALAQTALFRRGQHQRPSGASRTTSSGNCASTPAREHDARRRRLVDKVLHGPLSA